MTVTVCGRRSVLAALLSRREVRSIVLSRTVDKETESLLRSEAGMRDIPVRFAADADVLALARSPRHQGVVAVVGPMPAFTPVELVESAAKRGEPPFLVAVDGVEDAGNLGAIARTALLSGAHGIIVPERGTASIEAASRAASGAFAELPVAAVSSLANALLRLQREHLQVLAADANGGRAPWELDLASPLVLVLGSEDQGVSDRILDLADQRVCLPTPGGDLSLNVSAAASALCFERLRQLTSGPRSR